MVHLSNVFKAKNDTKQFSRLGYDNPRENIDPHIKTKVIETRELKVADKVLGNIEFSGNISGANLYISNNISGANLHAFHLASGAVLYVDSNKRISGANTVLFYDATNKRLGVGTDAPGRKLDVINDGDETVDIRAFSNTSGDFDARLDLISGTAGDAFIYLYGQSTGEWSLGLDNSDSDKFKLTKQGNLDGQTLITADYTTTNIGIGTESPIEKLEVVGTISGSNLYSRGNLSLMNSTPPASQGNAGRLFVSGGELWYLGSSNTGTRLANA